VGVRSVRDISPAARAGYDAIIDVRSPSEFTEDHVPGAINLPVLHDAERAEVGTLYVQQSKFLARRRGAALVARNISTHLDGALADRPGGFRPLVYCWRGGMRSGAMVTVMDQVGWPVARLDGGYQTWRRHVLALLHGASGRPAVSVQAFPWRLVLLDGPTGSGKTATLSHLADAGVQTLDLEGLAAHRGSLFGATGEPQPAQKLFESRLTAALEALDPARPVVVEAESSRIGALVLPARLWAAMKAAPRIVLSAPQDVRAAYSLSEYAVLASDAAMLDAALARLPVRHGARQIALWREMARRAADRPALVAELLEIHYDPAYRRMAARFEAPVAIVPAPLFASAPWAALARLVSEIDRTSPPG
jgi:tRNA 2-selenouridine synthase